MGENEEENQYKSPLEKLTEGVQKGNPKLVREAIEEGVDINADVGNYLNINFWTGDFSNYGYRPIHWAVRSGNLECIEILCKEGHANVNFQNTGGYTPLMTAIWFFIANYKSFPSDTLLNVAKKLFELGYDIDITRRGNTVLHDALKYAGQYHYPDEQKLPLLKLLIEKMNGNVNVKNNSGMTPIFSAAKKGDLASVKLLLNYNADVNVQAAAFDNNTPLHEAAASGKEDMAMLLLEAGAEINIKNNKHDTPIDIACLEAHSALAEKIKIKYEEVQLKKKELLQNKSKEQSELENTLFNIKNILLLTAPPSKNDIGNENLILNETYKAQMLEEKKAIELEETPSDNSLSKIQIDQQSEQEKGTSLTISFPSENIIAGEDTAESFTEEFLESNSSYQDVDLKDSNVTSKIEIKVKDSLSTEELSEIHYAVMQHDKAKLNKALKSVHVDKKSPDGLTALHLAAKLGYEDFVEILINHDASIESETESERKTPLHFAVESNHIKVVSKILNSKLIGANAKVDKKGNTSLHLAVEKKNKGIVKTLLEHANFSYFSKNNENYFSPLHLAVEHEQLDILKILIKFLIKKINSRDILKFRNIKGDTFFHMAAKLPREKMLSWILSKDIFPIDLANAYGYTPLHSAVEAGNLSAVVMLLEKGAKLETKNFSGQSIFYTLSEKINLAYESNPEKLKDYQEILEKLVECRKKQFLNLILNKIFKNKNIPFAKSSSKKKELKKMIFSALDEDAMINKLIKKSEWDYLLEISSFLRKMIQEEIPKIKPHEEIDFKKSLSKIIENGTSDLEHIDDQTQKELNTLIDYYHQAWKLNAKSNTQINNKESINSIITEEEKEFIEVLGGILKKYYYVSEALMDEMVLRQKSTVDKGLDAVRTAAEYLPQIGKGIAAASHSELVKKIAEKVGFYMPEISTEVGEATGTFLKFVSGAITNLIEKKLDENTKKRASNIVSAFKNLSKGRIDEDNIHLICVELAMRFKDQINALKLNSVSIFAECVGQRIFNHILKGASEYVDESDYAVSRILQNMFDAYRKKFSATYNPRVKRHILDRCLLALKNETHGRDIELVTKESRSNEQKWYASGIIELTGAKIWDPEAKKFVYYFSSEKKPETYGCFYALPIEIEMLKKKGIGANFLAQDIFNKKEKNKDVIYEKEEKKEKVESSSSIKLKHSNENTSVIYSQSHLLMAPPKHISIENLVKKAQKKLTAKKTVLIKFEDKDSADQFERYLKENSDYSKFSEKNSFASETIDSSSGEVRRGRSNTFELKAEEYTKILKDENAIDVLLEQEYKQDKNFAYMTQ